jgi:hypothetical protein
MESTKSRDDEEERASAALYETPPTSVEKSKTKADYSSPKKKLLEARRQDAIIEREVTFVLMNICKLIPGERENGFLLRLLCPIGRQSRNGKGSQTNFRKAME